MVSMRASPVAGMTRACLPRRTGLSRPKGATSAVAVEPDGLAVQLGEGDGVVEGAGGGDGIVEGNARADKGGVGRNAGGGEHGDQQGVICLCSRRIGC